MTLDGLEKMEIRFTNKEISVSDVKKELENIYIGFCYEAGKEDSKIVKNDKFKSLLLEIEVDKIKKWLDKVISEIEEGKALSDVINGKSRKLYVSCVWGSDINDYNSRISEVSYFQNVDSFYEMLIKIYSDPDILIKEPYKSVLDTILKNYHQVLRCKNIIHENDKDLSEALKEFQIKDDNGRE